MRVLLISKPLAPPWNDSGKNWARDIATYAPEGVMHDIAVPRGAETQWAGSPRVRATPLGPGQSDFAPAIMVRARSALRLLKPAVEIVHFCFAPNWRSNLAALALMTFRRRPTVHTVLSVPRSFDSVDRLLFADRIVCVSNSTANRLQDAGVQGVEVVRAAIPVPDVIDDAQRLQGVRRRCDLDPELPIVLFAGDYEFGRGADIFADAIAHLWRDRPVQFVFACRAKTPEAARHEQRLRSRLALAVGRRRVAFVGEVTDIAALLATTAVVAMPLTESYAKMDIPLVLLEALAQQTPIVISDIEPLRETLGPRAEASGGLVVAPAGSHLADAIATVLEDESLRHRLGREGRRHVVDNHNASVECQRYGGIYSSLL